jgi:hypothetical protein
VAERRAILIHPDDDVAVAVETCRAGDELVFAGGRVTAGHPIGRASVPIDTGDVVHTHNLGGVRGRGDLAAESGR